MSPAAAKRTALAAASVTALVALSIIVPAGGASSDPRDKQAPTTPLNLRVIAATPSLVSVAWDPSVDDVGVAGYYVFGDKGKATVDTPVYMASELGCGQSTVLNVIAFDEAQNRSDRATLTVSTAACPDTQAPVPPSGFTQLATTRDAVVLGWTPSTDNTGVVEYGVYRDLQRVATSAEPNVSLGGLACGSTYTYAVDAADASGNRSLRSNAFVRTASCPTSPPSGDTTPPSAPTGLAASGVTQTGLALSWNASSDNVGVTGYDVYRNGAKVASPTTTNLSQSSLVCGTSYAFAVAARDAAGNTSNQGQLSLSTSACSQPSPGDTTPPSAPSGLGVSGATSTSIALTWTASSDNVGVAGYRVYVNSANAATTAQLGATVSGLACGSAYVFEVDAFDLAGNNSTRASVTGSTAACADTQAPSAPLNVAATSRTATSIALAWSASTDNIGVTGYGLYRSGSQVATTSTTNAIFLGLTCNTNYTLAVDAYDGAGNRSSKTTVMVATTACLDTMPPSTPTGLAASSVTQTSLSLSWTASSDNVGVTGYDVYRNGTKMATVSSTSSSQTGLACGTSYTFGVVARDAAGNSSLQASIQVSTSACPPPPPPPPPSGAPYLDANFANGNYAASMVTVFESYTVDPRIAPDWGGLPAVDYDANGMTHDPNQRVRLVAPPVPLRNQQWVSRQEVRQTDGPWGNSGNAATYDKSTIRSDTGATLGGAFSPGMVRWFAYDYLLPLNLNGDTFNFVTSGHQTLMDCHETTSTPSQTWNALDLGTVRNDNGRQLGADIQTTGNTGPSGIGDYRRINYLDLTDASGNRISSAYNVWHQLVVGVKFSDQGVAGNSPGWLEIWNDGVNVMPRESRPTSLAGSGGCWLQAQMYKMHDAGLVGGANSTVTYFGGFRAGLTKADAER